MGSDAKIDMRPSSVWLREKTAKWPWKTHLRVGAKRDEALEILSSEGTLLVLCSLVDNMPYVVAEAAVRRSLLHFLPSQSWQLSFISSWGQARHWPCAICMFTLLGMTGVCMHACACAHAGMPLRCCCLLHGRGWQIQQEGLRDFESITACPFLAE